MKQLKKLTSVVLTLAILASTFIIGGIFPDAATAEDTATAIDLDYGETYTFNFDNVIEYKANTDPATDAEGNVFYPWRSADDKATAKGATITYDGNEISALELSASGSGMYIPTDENGQPLVIEPNSTYKVTVSSYALALGAYKQFFLGGGIYEANKPAYSGGGSKTFPDSIAWDDADYDMTATYPLYRTKSGQYAGSAAKYWPEYRQQKDSVLYFNTGDYDAENGLITAIASDGECYSFANYFGIHFAAGSVGLDEYTGNSVIYFDSISVTKTAGMEIGESYTFDFDEGDVKSYTANSTASTDGEGNTFYPLHAVNGTESTVTQENITATVDAQGNTETVGTLKLSTNGITQYIPTDKNGHPFVLEPNTKYSVQIKAYAQYVAKEGQMFFGGGIFNADQQDYYMLYSKYNNSSSWYYVDGTSNGSASSGMYAAYPMFRTSSYLYNSKGGNMYTSDTATTVLRYYDDFDKTRTAQYSDASRVFTTSDFTETYSDTVNDTNGNNVFETDLWQWYKWAKKTDPAITDPYSDEAVAAGVEVKTETVGAYFGIFCDGGQVTGYYDDGTGTRVATATQNTTFYIDSITITKVSQTASVTYDANGGAFSDDTTSQTVTENVGGDFTVDEPSYPGDTKVFKGWSLSADSDIAVQSVDASLHGKTLYAIWGDPDPHPADGVYDTFSRTIEFNKDENGEFIYVITGNNTFIPTGEDYGEYSGVPYFEVVDDPNEEGDGILHYYNHSGASNWYANWSITPTVDGVSSNAAAIDGGQVLSTNSTYKLTMRVRINDTDGTTAEMAMFYGTGSGRNSYTDGTNASGHTTLISGLKATDDFVDLTAYFTTPAEYTTVTNGVANRLFVGIKAPDHKLDYDLDYIKLEKVTNTNLYVKKDGEYVLQDTLEGVPGTELIVPEYYSEETYSLYDPTGSDSKVIYGNWFSDEACTESAIMKYGNYDVDIYCDEVTSVSVSTENQEMFVGFDTYTQRTDGLDGAEITDDTCNSGKYSLKATDGTAFELKNDHTLDVAEGKTYKVDFMYKATADATLGIGLAQGLVSNGVNAKNTVSLAAADGWTAASVIFTADGTQENTVLAAAVTSEGTVYLDSMIVSSATESVGVEATSTEDGEALRFMLSYNGNDTVKLAGTDYIVTEHGVLVKGEENTAALDLGNTDAAGVFHFAQTDLSKNWSVNPITGTTVYSAYLEGFDADDDYKVAVRGYLSFPTVLYSIPIHSPHRSAIFLPPQISFPRPQTLPTTTYISRQVLPYLQMRIIPFPPLTAPLPRPLR